MYYKLWTNSPKCIYDRGTINNLSMILGSIFGEFERQITFSDIKLTLKQWSWSNNETAYYLLQRALALILHANGLLNTRKATFFMTLCCLPPVVVFGLKLCCWVVSVLTCLLKPEMKNTAKKLLHFICKTLNYKFNKNYNKQLWI